MTTISFWKTSKFYNVLRAIESKEMMTSQNQEQIDKFNSRPGLLKLFT